MSSSSSTASGASGASASHSAPAPPATSANEKAALCDGGDEEMLESELAFGWPDWLFLQPVDELLRCPICALTMRDALQCSQQHCFCSPCIYRALEGKKACPLCRDPLRPAELQANRMVRALVDRLQVKCVHSERGCTAPLTLGEWDAHARRCDFRLVRCENHGCAALVPKRGLNAHMASCDFGAMECSECGAEFPSNQRQAHSCMVFLRQLVRDLHKRLTAKDAEVIRLRNAQSQLESRLDALEHQSATILARLSGTSSPFHDAGGGGGGNMMVMGGERGGGGHFGGNAGVGGGGGSGGLSMFAAAAFSAYQGGMRPALNDIVVLSEVHHMFGDAADGPLMTGVAGWVIADDEADDLPIRVHVHSRGEWWYAVGALRVVARAGDRITRETALKGVPVVRGADWKWDSQDGGAGCLGFILRSKGDWCDVTWVAGDMDNAYRVGPRKFDLVVACMNGSIM